MNSRSKEKVREFATPDGYEIKIEMVVVNGFGILGDIRIIAGLVHGTRSTTQDQLETVYSN